MPYMHSSMALTLTVPTEGDAAHNLVQVPTSAPEPSTSADAALLGGKQREQTAKADDGGAEDGSSRPPSPPSSGTTTPTLRIAPCPSRLWSFVPPPQYGVVDDYTIYRSSYPQDRNIEFIRSLDIKSILTLVATEPTPGYVQWIKEFGIKQGVIAVAPNKEAKEGKAASSASLDSICEALLFMLDARNHPMWVHCNQGRHRTGCVIACLRKIQGMPVEDALEEYVVYASPKIRSGDIALIKSFDPSALFTYAVKTGFIGGPNPTFKHSGPDAPTDVYELAYELTHAARQDSLAPADQSTEALEHLSSTLSDVSMDEDEESDLGLEIAHPRASPSRPAPVGVKQDGASIVPQLLARPHDITGAPAPTTVSVVDVNEDSMQDVEMLALHGELDPTLDHESVAVALS